MGKVFQPYTEDLYQYLLDVSLRETDLQVQLRKKTTECVEFHGMMSTPDQVQFIALLLQLMQAGRVIEVGVFTGYGTLGMAMALPDDGYLLGCDIGKDWPAIGKPFWEQAGVAHKIDLRVGLALDTLKAVAADNVEPFDAAFIDADKIHYAQYFDVILPMIRSGGLIMFDNVIRIGDAVVHEQEIPGTKAVFQLMQRLRDDDRVDVSMVPVSQGMMLVRKK